MGFCEDIKKSDGEKKRVLERNQKSDELSLIFACFLVEIAYETFEVKCDAIFFRYSANRGSSDAEPKKNEVQHNDHMEDVNKLKFRLYSVVSCVVLLRSLQPKNLLVLSYLDEKNIFRVVFLFHF